MSTSSRAISESPTLRRATVLVVDDSAFMRRVVSDLIIESGEFDVVGTARDGAHALEQVRALNPDIVTLDVEMPGHDGLDALRDIMRIAPRPVVMLSAGGAAGGIDATLRALELGAVEFVRKPSGAISLDLERVRDHIVNALRAARASNRNTLGVAARTAPSSSAPPHEGLSRHTVANACTSDDATRLRESSARVADSVVCIAASTGGPAALAALVPALPRFSQAAVVIAQHLPAGFTASLARRLSSISSLTVREAIQGEPLLAGHVYVSPGGQHTRLTSSECGVTIVLGDDAPLWGVRPAADHLFASAASLFGARAIGVVLTGMGCDGAAGLFAIRHAGGIGIVQSPDSAVISGMPASALRHAGAEHVVALADMARTIAGEAERLNAIDVAKTSARAAQ